MPLRNRVAPDGSVVATPARGTMYGNRGGCFHRDDGTLKDKQWASRQWICCVLQFKGRRRTLLQPGKFTELFFLDEATAFAAGHRPCFECRRADAVRYQALWQSAKASKARPSAPEMDAVLHAQRLNARGTASVAKWAIETLPDGAMYRDDGIMFLLAGETVRPWSFAGYGPAVARPPAGLVTVLTPMATMAVLQAGYRVAVHPSATG